MRGPGVPIVAISGPQGAGKSTLAARMTCDSGLRVAAFSLDDVYLPRRARERLARDVHPLFATRGPPGTHDVALALETIGRLNAAGPRSRTQLPRFDKRADDPAPRRDWPVFVGRPDVIVLDGWRLGALPQEDEALARPVNALEAQEDRDGVWRRAANDFLRRDTAQLDSRIDRLIRLAAPDFAVVERWRCEQEAALMGLAADALPDHRRAWVARFIQHYERITRHMLAGGARADVIIRLDADRRPMDGAPAAG